MSVFSLLFLQMHTPVPKDIPMDFPMPEWVLTILLVVSFLFHIIFVNLMVGGSIVTLWAQLRGLKNPDYDRFANEIAKTITVNKSIAVVLGVAPLLSINTLYTIYFYSANALTGFAWIMIIPLVTIAFLLTYLHKYTWEALADHKRIHISIIALSVAVFLFIPLIFLTNVNLMMFPEKWGSVQGFVSALMLPNVFPRYLEFLGACIAVTGVFIVWYNSRKNYPVETIYTGFSRRFIKQTGYSVAIVGLGLQIIFGLIVLVTLPAKGIGFDVVVTMGLAGCLLLLALWYCYQCLAQASDTHFYKIVASVLVFMLLYGSSRQMYRHNSLDKHRTLMASHTREFQRLSKEAREKPENEEIAVAEADGEPDEFAKGAAIFKSNCSACHKPYEQLVGPPITEMVSIYKDHKAGLKQWIKAPGKKRPDASQMPAFAYLSDDELKELANYILSIE